MTIMTLTYGFRCNALAIIFWNKQPLARYLRGMLRDVPKLLADLDFYGETKRESVGRLVDHLLGEEAKYQAVTIALMLDVSGRRRRILGGLIHEYERAA